MAVVFAGENVVLTTARGVRNYLISKDFDFDGVKVGFETPQSDPQ